MKTNILQARKALLALFAMLMPLVASAQTKVEIDGIWYNLITKGKVAEVTSGDTKHSGSITLPATVTYEGVQYGVTSIGDYAFDGCSNLTSITIPEGVTSIGDYAFRDCSSLTSITIPESVTSIGSSVFFGCDDMNNIRCGAVTPPVASGPIFDNDNNNNIFLLILYVPMPSVDAYIKAEYWKDAEAIAGFILPGTCGDNLIWSLSDDGELIIEGTGDMYDFADIEGSFTYVAPWRYSPVKVKNVKVGEGVTSIGDYAFYDCSDLTSITIPENVTSIGGLAFSGCSSLVRITIPEGVKSIGESTFSGCSSLVRITIPESVKSIGDYAFYGCSSLTSFSIPESVTSIGSSVFSDCSSLVRITIPESVTSIGSSVFENCSSLVRITIPESVTSIGWHAFSGCSGLTDVDVHIASVESWLANNLANSIGRSYSLYLAGELLTKVEIPSSVNALPNHAFYNCNSLTSVIIPESMTSIGNNAFSGCSSLTDVDVHIASVESWFANNLANSIGRSYSLYLAGELLTKVEIPSSVNALPNHAFYNCNSLTSVIIPEGVTSIGESAFYSCSKLKTISLPKTLSIIKKHAFVGCSSLGSVIIPEIVEFIYQEAFAECWSLQSVKVLATEPPFAYDNTFPHYGIELCVPEETMEAYRTIAPWSNFTTIRNLEGEEVEVKQCAVPVIDYIDGKVLLTCETEGVSFKSSITADDARSYDEAAYALAGTYSITAYATKEGYEDSNVSTLTICWIPCTEKHDNNINTEVLTIPSKPVLIQSQGGTITLSGLAAGTEVGAYDTAGNLLAEATSADGGTATLATNLTKGDIVIVKIGNNNIKVIVK